MNILRVRSEITVAAQHFPNIEAHPTTTGGIYVKAALQTAVGQVYFVNITFDDYPSASPKVSVTTPAINHFKHRYNSGHICYMHPNLWNPARHDLKYVLSQVAVWLNKHEVYKVNGRWPGPGLEHN